MAEIKKINIDGVEYDIGGGNSLLVVENTAEAIEAAGGFEYLLNNYKLIGFEVNAYGASRTLHFQSIESALEGGEIGAMDFHYFVIQNTGEGVVANTYVGVTLGTFYDVATIEVVQYIVNDPNGDSEMVGYEDDNYVRKILFM